MITVNYNNTTYYVEATSTLSQLLKRKDLLELPLEIWRELIMKKDKVCFHETLLKILDAKIVDYDTSTNVNAFIVGNNKYWLDKFSRVSLQHLVNCSKDKVSVVLGNDILEVPVSVAADFLSRLEVYAGQCYLVTAKHRLNIKELQTIEDLVNYDYTKGYPDKVIFA